jgi:uncharacterized protein (DUF2267 family)
MTHDEFIGQVQHRAQLSSRGAAERTTRVVLEILGQRLAGGEVDHLASQLPPEIGRHLLEEDAGMGERFSLDDFLQLVAIREDVDQLEAEQHARAVLSVLSEAISEGEFEDALAQLPQEFDTLFIWTEQARL